MAKVKVLLCSPSKGIVGGIHRWTQHILSYYSQHPSDISLELFSMDREFYVNLEENFLGRLWYGAKEYLLFIKSFRKFIRKRRDWDVCHIVSSASLGLIKDFLLIRIAKSHKIKTIIHFRFGRIPQLAQTRNWEWKLLSSVVKSADKVIVIDPFSDECLKKNGFNNVVYLPNPISQQVLDTIETIGKPTRQHNEILFVGHVILTKGIFELIDACKDISNIKVKFVGYIEDCVREQLKGIIPADDDKFEICGEMPYNEVLAEMMRCGLLALPTYTEGFPNVILEAMACGCPIITTPVGAIPEMIDLQSNMPCGVCVPVKNVEILKEKIEYYLTHQDEALRMGERARNRVVSEYSMLTVWNKLVKVWESLYDKKIFIFI